MLNSLSLNLDGSEAIIIGTGARQRSVGPLDVIDLIDMQIPPSESVCSLGVHKLQLVQNFLTYCNRHEAI